MTLANLNIDQVAYFVDDVRRSAADMTRTFGAGPFFVIDRIELAWCRHRGEDCPFVHTSAYGQWGEVMMELVQQESEGASPFRDLFDPGTFGLHHVATIVDDLTDAKHAYENNGLSVATEAQTLGGTEFAFIDATQTMGHFIEIYERSEELVGFYAMVREAASGWQGDQPLRTL